MAKNSCECECRVPIGLAEEQGLAFAYVGAEGVSIEPDWAGRPSISVADARRLSEKVRAEAVEHEAAWAEFERARKQWVADRHAAVIEASREAGEAARRRGKSPGAASAKAQDAAREAGERYERTVPRPTWQNLPPSKVVALEYISEDDLSPKGVLKLASKLSGDKAGVA